jgi:hypothetical protein
MFIKLILSHPATLPNFPKFITIYVGQLLIQRTSVLNFHKYP